MRLLCFFLTGLLLAPHALAQSVPIPASKEQELGNYEKKLKDTKASKASLEKDLQDLEKTLKETQNDLVKTAKDIQGNEKDLQNLDLRIEELEREKADLSQKLQNDRGSISNLILALERIRRMPPEALIARPDAPFKTAQSAMLLEEILPALHTQAEDLKQTLAKLQDVSTDLENKKADVLSKSEKLAAQQKELQGLVDSRKTLYAETNDNIKAEQARIETISSQAQNLQDLVQKLNEERTRAQNAQKAAAGKPRVVGQNLPKSGEPRLPLPGIIKIGYDEPDNFGAPSKGLDIEGRTGALVVAPMGGIIRFAGYFKNYGNMVIIEHESDWHSLVAGLENIDTVVGQTVKAGEPLGVLHQSASGQQPVLYYELRHHGKPVDPAKKFGELS